MSLIKLDQERGKKKNLEKKMWSEKKKFRVS